MGFAIGTSKVDGLAFAGEKVGGFAIGSEKVFSSAQPAPVDQPGTLTIVAQRISGRNPYQVNATVTDPDGIRAVTSAIFTSAVDSQTSDRTAQFARTDANTFSTGARALRNARWARSSVVVTYTDGLGNTSTLTQSYAIA